MNLTNESYVIRIGTKNFTELYYREMNGWMKVSSQGNVFPATAEQVLNHVLPVLAGIKLGVTMEVEHYDDPEERNLHPKIGSGTNFINKKVRSLLALLPLVGDLERLHHGHGPA